MRERLARSRLINSAVAAALLLMAAGSPAVAAERVALVIGNSAYQHVPALANPVNDATDVGGALARLGFSVTWLEDAGYAALRQGLREFQRAAAASDIAVVFYAGHGIEVDQRNFIVPVDARLVSDQDVEFEAVPLDLVSRAVGRASRLRLVILDACRENPFAVQMQRAGPTRSIGRGLARVEPSGQMLVAYAAKEGTVALDGDGRNSPYTSALLGHLEEAGLEVGLMFRKVRDAVVRSTDGRQEPFTYGSLSSEGVYFTEAPVVRSDEAAAKAYEVAERVGTIAGYRAVVEAYPGSVYAGLAREQTQALQAEIETLEGEVQTLRGEIQALEGDIRVLEGKIRELKGGDSSPPDPKAVESSLELDRSERRLVQVGLSSLGFDPGPADGLFGRGARGAIERLQSSRGLSATGYLDMELAKELLSAAGEAIAADDAAFAGARSSGSSEAYASYLGAYPDGRHASEARRLRAEAEAVERLGPGAEFRECPGCPAMVVVPAGSFRMGSPAEEAGRYDDEGPDASCVDFASVCGWEV